MALCEWSIFIYLCQASKFNSIHFIHTCTYSLYLDIWSWILKFKIIWPDNKYSQPAYTLFKIHCKLTLSHQSLTNNPHSVIQLTHNSLHWRAPDGVTEIRAYTVPYEKTIIIWAHNPCGRTWAEDKWHMLKSVSCHALCFWKWNSFFFSLDVMSVYCFATIAKGRTKNLGKKTLRDGACRLHTMFTEYYPTLILSILILILHYEYMM